MSRLRLAVLFLAILPVVPARAQQAVRAAPWGALRGIARAARRLDIPSTRADSVELVAAWDAPRGSVGGPRQVLLFTIRPDSLPAGRPCAIRIADHPGLVFRLALGGGGGATDEFWAEAYWPGHVLAVGGGSMEAYDLAFAVFRAVTTVP